VIHGEPTSPTELHKRVAAYHGRGLEVNWVAQGYVSRETGELTHAGIIRGRELTKAYLDAEAYERARGRRVRFRVNPEDGHEFYVAFWDTLWRHGNATTLKTIEPAGRKASPALAHREIDMACPDCWRPSRHRRSWRPHSRTGRLICFVCHPEPGSSEFERQWR
jgi:hypothetical protein